MITRRKLKFLLLLFIGLFSIQPVFAQTVKNESFSDIRVDALGDAKIRDFMREVESLGLSLDQVDQVALSRGMSVGEVRKLKARVERIRREDARLLRESRIAINSQDSIRKGGIDTLTGLKRAELENQADQALTALRSKIFGADIFSNRQLNFEPSLNIAPPQNYRVGPGDELVVDVYGLSEASYTKTVTPEGTISIPYAGVVQVAGLSLSDIRQKLTASLSSIYSGIKNGNTFVRVSTGKLRSIKVTVIGEVTKPGTFTIPSVSTVFTALYASGGPTDRGSYRKIEVLRDNRLISTLDVYDFLLGGDQKNNITLRDQDVIRIPVYENRVEFDGEVKRPRIFEVLQGETLADVLRFAGGFSSNAYTARVKVLQNTSRERKITDVSEDEFSKYIPKSGDKYIAEPILDRFENRVVIDGAVFRPGSYELEKGLTLRSLIKKSEGLKETAFLPRGYITRTKADGNLELISFNPGKIVSGADPDIPLMREDMVSISSIFDLKDEFSVSIDGEVRNPGQFNFAEGMNLEDLILKAGGLKEGASISRIEVARRIDNSNKDQASAKSAEIFQISVENDLSDNLAEFILKPYDIVSVRRSEGYEVQRQVSIYGEVKYPGIYFISRKNERISDLIARAGGPTVFAYFKGASLERGNVVRFAKSAAETAQGTAEDKAFSALGKLRENAVSSSSDTVEVNKLVGIDLDKILKNPGSDIDLFLEEGDLISVPKQPQTVKVTGNVLLPGTAIYTPTKGFMNYISESGGFKQNAAKRRAYVKYANGSVKATQRTLLFFNSYPRITPGAEIVVPKNENVRKVSVQEVLGVTTGLITTILLALTLIKK